MVFSSLPSYVDPPSWPQQQAAGGVDHEICELPPPPPSLGRSVQILEAGRMAKPDTAMKCPRCESTNTKFCYFNNYSLSQPRHFCKTCRRYWTRGGALRNVPVGGGCRRNKKSNKGKSPSTSNMTPPPAADIPVPHFPILHHFGGGDLGLTYGTGGNTTGSTHHLFNPIMEASNAGGMYGEGPTNYAGMKMEETHHHQAMNLSRNFLSATGNDHFLGTSNIAWGTTDLTGFTSSSSTTHPL